MRLAFTISSWNEKNKKIETRKFDAWSADSEEDHERFSGGYSQRVWASTIIDLTNKIKKGNASFALSIREQPFNLEDQGAQTSKTSNHELCLPIESLGVAP